MTIPRSSLQLSLKGVRDKYHITETELAAHLCVNKHSIQRYENGNLEVPLPVRKLLALLVERWEEKGYEPPEEE